MRKRNPGRKGSTSPAARAISLASDAETLAKLVKLLAHCLHTLAHVVHGGTYALLQTLTGIVNLLLEATLLVVGTKLVGFCLRLVKTFV